MGSKKKLMDNDLDFMKDVGNSLKNTENGKVKQ